MLQTSSTPKNSTTVRSQNAIWFTRAALQAAYLVSDDLGSSLAERLFTSPRRFPRPARERAILASGRRFTVEVALRSPRWAGTTGASTEVVAWRWGLGPTVLLVHGWEGRGAQLGALVEPLVAAGMSVVAFDAPGHGDSPGSRLYLTDLADTILDVADAVGPIHAIIAHSFGAAASLLAYERGGLDASRNVMIAPNVVIEDSLAQFGNVLGLDEADRLGLELGLAEHSGVLVEDLHLERLVGDRDAGLTVIHDRDDREVPCTQGERLADLWPNAHLHITGGLGHNRILRDPQVITEAVEAVRQGVPLPPSDLVREVDRLVAQLDQATETIVL